MYYKDDIIQKKPLFEPIPLHRRTPFVPECGYCSITPAEFYQDALVSANCGIKMLVFGNPTTETVIFNHEKLYTKKFRHHLSPPDIAAVLPSVRKLLLEGKSKEACELSVEEARKQGYRERMVWHGNLEIPYSNDKAHSAFAMKYQLESMGSVTNYLRTLDFTSGEATVRWDDANGSYLRTSFVSEKDGLCIQNLTTLSGTEGFSGNISITLDAILGKHDWERMDTPKDLAVYSSCNGNVLLLGCAYNPEIMGQRGYAVLTKVQFKHGSVIVGENKITLCGVKELTLTTKVELLETYSKEAVLALSNQLKELCCDIKQLLQQNRETIGRKMARSRLSLNAEAYQLHAVEELFTLQHSSQLLCAPLLEHLYNSGRYFLITESGTLPPAIGQYNINVNLQVCSGNLTDLPESMDTFFRFIESKMEDFRINAKHLFGCRGIVAPVHLDVDNGLGTHFSSTWPHHYWVACAGWIYNEFWGHYLVSGDLDFLEKRVIPALREIALFFEDYLTDTDENGNYLFYPCYSPEHCPGGDWSGVTINSCMDIMVCREVLENLLTAYKVLDIQTEETEKWQAILSRLPTYLADEEGALKEWAWQKIPEEYDHRHVSHHYDVWPGNGITWEKTPHLAQAVLLSNRKRGQENDSAHGLMHRLFTAIRLKDVSGTYALLKEILDHGFINRNLMTNHYPYSVYFPDITGSMPAALAELFVYSNPGIIELLPTVPDDFSKGILQGLCCYTFAHIDSLEWELQMGKIRVVITSLADQTITIQYRHQPFELTVQGQSRTVTNCRCEVTFTQGETLILELLIKR